MKLIYFFAIGLLIGSIFSCYKIEEVCYSREGREYNMCGIVPEDVPLEYVWGPSVRWDCNLQSAYIRKELIIIYPDNLDSNKCESLMYISYSGDTVKCDFEKMAFH